MTRPRLRSLGSVLLAAAGATLVGATSTVGVNALAREVALLAEQGWIMSGTGVPDPSASYLSQVENLYLQQYAGYNFVGLSTPEQFCPIVCLPPPNPQLNFGDSLAQGVLNLDGAIRPQLLAGDDVTVLGYSQSSVIATIEMQNLIANPPTDPDYDPANLHFVFLGAPNSPLGGILDRFVFSDGIGPYFSSIDQHVPFLNIPLGIGAAPTDTFNIDYYTAAYDGWANFPADPTNLLAVINALVGIATVHPYYPYPDPGVNLDINNIIDLGSIGQATYHMIPAPLPLLAWMYDGGDAGRIFYDMFAPNLALSINWAYGNPGDPFVGVNGTDAIGPWAVNASGDLIPSAGAGFMMQMDPLQMLAGMQWAGVQSFVNPVNDILNLIYGGSIPGDISTFMTELENSMLSGYDFTNQLDQLMLGGIDQFGALFGLSDLSDVVFSGAPLISAQPLLDLVGWGFDAFNLFGA